MTETITALNGLSASGAVVAIVAIVATAWVLVTFLKE